MSQIIAADPGRVTRFHADEGRFHVQTTFDAEPTLELAKALHNEGKQENMLGHKHAMRIDAEMVNAWAIKRGVTFDAVMQDSRLLKEMVNDPDLSHFRVYKGAI